MKDCELTMIPDGTLDRRDTVSSEAWEGPGVRTGSVVSRHFSVATKVSGVSVTLHDMLFIVPILFVICLFTCCLLSIQAKFLTKEGWLAKTGGNNKVTIMPIFIQTPQMSLYHLGLERSIFCAYKWEANILQK